MRSLLFVQESSWNPQVAEAQQSGKTLNILFLRGTFVFKSSFVYTFQAKEEGTHIDGMSKAETQSRNIIMAVVMAT